MEIIALRTFDSREYGLIRTGLKLTVDERYGKDLLRRGLVKVHIPPDIEQAPRNAALGEAPRKADPPNPPAAGRRRPARAAGSATGSSGRPPAVGKAPRSS